MILLNKTDDTLWLNSTVMLDSESEEGYAAMLDIFHQLHCLVRFLGRNSLTLQPNNAARTCFERCCIVTTMRRKSQMFAWKSYMDHMGRYPVSTACDPKRLTEDRSLRRGHSADADVR